MMEGHEVITTDLFRSTDPKVLSELGFNMTRVFARACSLCPRDDACKVKHACSLKVHEFWVPTHVAAIMKMQPSNR